MGFLPVSVLDFRSRFCPRGDRPLPFRTIMVGRLRRKKGRAGGGERQGRQAGAGPTQPHEEGGGTMRLTNGLDGGERQGTGGPTEDSLGSIH